MHTNAPREDPLTDLGYEVRDVNLTSIYKSLVWFVVFAIAMLIIGYVALAKGVNLGFMKIDPMSPVYSGRQPQDSGIKVLPGAPNPLIQSNITTKVDIQVLRKGEVKALNSYGYADAAKTAATLPIDEAMKRVSEGENLSTGAVVPAISKGNTTDQKREPPVETGAAAPATRSAPTPERAR